MEINKITPKKGYPTIGFWTPQLDVRGSCDALFNYADQYEKMLGGKSIIITPKNSNNEIEAIFKFNLRFSILKYDTLENMDELLIKNNCKILYLIKHGQNDNIYSRIIPNIIHCVFDLSQPHGEIYIAVSEQLAHKFNRPNFLPHMITIKRTTNENLRKELNIPKTSLVFGRYGGMDTFDLQFVREVIRKIVKERNDIYFLLGNTPEFDNHPQIIHIPRFSDMYYKQKFINTCDAYIEAGRLGHSFGLAQGEFSVFNKPIIMYGGPVWNDSHRKIMGDKGIYYNNCEEFYDIIVNFYKYYDISKDYNCYKQYSPENVMKIFESLIIKLLNRQ